MSVARVGCVILCALPMLVGRVSAQLSESKSSFDAASGDEQIIEDPELAARGVSEPAPSSSDGVIVDPELSQSSSMAAQSGNSEPAPAGFLSEAHLVLHARLGRDLYQGDPREEIWEQTSIAMLETTVRRSESLRFVLGMRARFHLGALAGPVPDAPSQRLDIDVAPTAAYVDVKLMDGANLQLGYQPVQLGRFDIFSGTNVLSVYDSRDGLATLPEAAVEIAQLAARLDYEPTGWLSLRAIYVPFFTPHIMSVTESDYALFPQTQAAIDANLGMLGLTNVVANYLSRNDREHLANSALAVFSPEIAANAQQAALRVAAHGGLGELAFTAVTALEHLPSFHFSPEAIDAIREPMSIEVAERLEKVARPVTVDYRRFGVLSLDGAVDIAPVSVGLEAAYMFNRTLFTLGTGPYPGTLPLAETTDVMQLGARVEYVEGTEFGLTVEAFAAYAMRAPADPTRGWVFLESQRYIAGIATAAGWAPEWGLRLELAALVLTGPTLFLTPRVGYVIVEGFEIEIGAVIAEGPSPPFGPTPRLSIGTLFDTSDQVYAGMIMTL